MQDKISCTDGKRVTLCSNIRNQSKNRKTGDMVQVSVMRSDLLPTQAKAERKDSAVCGQCPIKNICYVELGRSINSKYKAYKRGSYHEVSKNFKSWLESGNFTKPLRLGEYGDPAFMALDFLTSLIRKAVKGWTGYTHQWRHERFNYLRLFCMASVETPQQKYDANMLGFRTFRIVDSEADIQQDEVLCPWFKNKSVTCASCQLCNGCDSDRKVKSPMNIAALKH